MVAFSGCSLYFLEGTIRVKLLTIGPGVRTELIDRGHKSSINVRTRAIRDAEKRDPGVVRRAVDAAISEGNEPTKARVRKALVAPKPSPARRERPKF